jgi:hypothetical protein
VNKSLCRLLSASSISILSACADHPTVQNAQPAAANSQSAQKAGDSLPGPLPICPNGVETIDNAGEVRNYDGTDPSDAMICLARKSGAPLRLVWNYWPVRTELAKLSDVEQVLPRLMTGPAGTSAQLSWSTPKNSMNYTKLERGKDEEMTVAGKTYTVFTIHTSDNFGNDFMTWIDPATLIPLRGRGTYPSPYAWTVTDIRRK